MALPPFNHGETVLLPLALALHLHNFGYNSEILTRLTPFNATTSALFNELT